MTMYYKWKENFDENWIRVTICHETLGDRENKQKKYKQKNSGTPVKEKNLEHLKITPW